MKIPDVFNVLGWSLPWIVMLWVIIGLLILTVLGIALMFVTDDGGLFLAIMAGITLVVAGAIAACMAIPYDTKYMKDYRVTGDIVSVSNVLDSADGQLTRVPVVELDNVSWPLVVDNARATTLDKGDTVTLRCRISWHYRAADRYNCDLYSVSR